MRGSVDYDPVLLTFSLVLATVAGVLTVLGAKGVAGLGGPDHTR